MIKKVNRITSKEFLTFLEGHDSEQPGESLEIDPYRVSPALLPDMTIFGKSLAAHRLCLPTTVNFEEWLFAYEDALVATREDRDPIMAIASSLDLPEKQIRNMLSGYKVSFNDEMHVIAERMAYAAALNFSEASYSNGMFYYDNQPVMGVSDFIHSAYGNSIPVRTRFNSLTEPTPGCTHRVGLKWLSIYKKYAWNPGVIRVLDTIVVHSPNPAYVLTWFTGNYHYESLKKIKSKEIKSPKRIGISGETVAILEETLNFSNSPIRDLYSMLVPISLSAKDFLKFIGNPSTQRGKLKDSTAEKIREWIRSSRLDPQQQQTTEQ